MKRSIAKIKNVMNKPESSSGVDIFIFIFVNLIGLCIIFGTLAVLLSCSVNGPQAPMGAGSRAFEFTPATSYTRLEWDGDTIRIDPECLDPAILIIKCSGNSIANKYKSKSEALSNRIIIDIERRGEWASRDTVALPAEYQGVIFDSLSAWEYKPDFWKLTYYITLACSI